MPFLVTYNNTRDELRALNRAGYWSGHDEPAPEEQSICPNVNEVLMVSSLDALPCKLRIKPRVFT